MGSEIRTIESSLNAFDTAVQELRQALSAASAGWRDMGYESAYKAINAMAKNVSDVAIAGRECISLFEQFEAVLDEKC